MKLGDRVECTAYVRRSKNYYEMSKGVYGGFEDCVYWEYGSDKGVDVENCHSCDRFRLVEHKFSGIFVGMTTLNTRINADYEEPPYGPSGFVTYCDRPQEFAVVYYADNKKRLVPLDRIDVAN